MIPSLVLVVVALFGGNVLAQADMNACSKGCAVGIFADPSRLGCKSEDKNCACHSGQNLMFGVRDCITQACGLTGAALDQQVAASEKFMNAECVPFTSTAAPATTAPPPAAAPAATSPATTAPPPAAPAASTAEPAKTSAVSPVVKDPPASSQPAPSTAAGATSAATSQPTTGASAAASADTPSGTSKSSSAASSPAAGVAASTASPTSSQAAGKKESEESNEGLSVAAKAGIGAGAGVVVVMAAITLCCIMMRRRRDNRTAPQGPARPARSPMPAISQPVNGRRQYAEDVESPAALNFPFPAVCEKGNNHGLPSPAAKPAYKAPASSHDDRYSVKGNRYEEMLPRTQPRTMI
ncbi:hypothetical protein PG995_009201 [Apiospora arundinis]